MRPRDTKALSIKAQGLATLRSVLNSDVARDLLILLELLDEERPDAGAVARVFGRLWEGLAGEDEGLLSDAWQSYLVGRVLDDENPFLWGPRGGRSGPPCWHRPGGIFARCERCSCWTLRCCSVGSSPPCPLFPTPGCHGRIPNRWRSLRAARSRASYLRRRIGGPARSFWPATTPGTELDPSAATGLLTGGKGDSGWSLVLTP